MFRNKIFLFGENYFYKFSTLNLIICIVLLPFSFLYFLIIIFKKIFAKPQNFGIKIISVGNLTLGGNGKTPLCKAIFEICDKKTFIILRGYERKSKGLKIVALNGEILCDLKDSGDEAMEYAQNLKFANVIVSEDRKKGILKAKKLGGEIVILDDGFGKFDIEKFEILLPSNVKTWNNFTLPSGPYRYPNFFYKFANFIPQKDDIKQTFEIINKKEKMFLVSAIAKPFRLNDFKNLCIGSKFYSDHFEFCEDELKKILKQSGANSILVTQKDFVKMQNFDIEISVIKMKLDLSYKFKEILKKYTNFS